MGLNLYDYGKRFYDPAVARWTTVDPLINDIDFTFNPNDVDADDDNEMAFAMQTTLSNGGGIYNSDNLNPYSYGYNDPVRFDDPDGRCPICVYVLAALLYSEFANAPTGNAKKDASDYNAAKGNKALVSNAVLGTAGVVKVVNVVSSNSAKSKAVEKAKDDIKTIVVDGKKHPESAKHLDDAIKDGKSNEGKVDRAGAAGRRKENMKGNKVEKGKDRDEAPPAVINTGEKSSVRTISPSDNRGAGASIGRQLEGTPDGTPVKIVPINVPKN